MGSEAKREIARVSQSQRQMCYGKSLLSYEETDIGHNWTPPCTVPRWAISQNICTKSFAVFSFWYNNGHTIASYKSETK